MQVKLRQTADTGNIRHQVYYDEGGGEGGGERDCGGIEVLQNTLRLEYTRHVNLLAGFAGRSDLKSKIMTQNIRSLSINKSNVL
jgi:hypothetical protein